MMIKAANVARTIHTKTAKGIQSGDKTHTHDQSILPKSFRVMNTIANRPPKPIPPFLMFDSEAPIHIALLFYRYVS